MKELVFFISIVWVLEADAQTYLINFTGTGESTSVNSVLVENLTTTISTSLTSGQILRLNVLTSVNQIENKLLSELKIYPNPMTDNAVVQVMPPVEGMATVTISDMNGKQIAKIQSYLENYLQEFCVSGIKSGLYLVSVKGRTFQCSGKLLCNTKSNGAVHIEKTSNSNQTTLVKMSGKASKGVPGYIDMNYTSGDRIKFTGISGNYSTVVTDIPASDKTINFNFIACTDGDGNNYPVVDIGGQIWMAENLQTTKYNDGTDIPNVIENTDWYLLEDGAFCWYNNNISNKTIHGALYNCFAVNDTRNLCPTGWHVPGHLYPNDEWQTFITYLGGNETAGGIMKSVGTVEEGTGLWNAPNYNATNESGFSALPSGNRYYDGTFHNIGNIGYWWSSSMPYFAYWYQVNYFNAKASYIYDHPNYGLSVRCIKN
jgi:uncharacterized protein (TIGR02145 family)